jgi:hypothetical protein
MCSFQQVSFFCLKLCMQQKGDVTILTQVENARSGLVTSRRPSECSASVEVVIPVALVKEV